MCVAFGIFKFRFNKRRYRVLSGAENSAFLSLSLSFSLSVYNPCRACVLFFSSSCTHTHYTRYTRGFIFLRDDGDDRPRGVSVSLKTDDDVLYIASDVYARGPYVIISCSALPKPCVFRRPGNVERVLLWHGKGKVAVLYVLLRA